MPSAEQRRRCSYRSLERILLGLSLSVLVLFGIYILAVFTAVLLLCVTHSDSVRAISERGTLRVMLVMGKAGHRLQQGRATQIST